MKWKFTGRLRRRTAVAAALLAVYALVGFFVVPPIARSQIVKLARTLLHREAAVERVRFNPFTLTGVIEGLDLKDRDGAPLFKVRRFEANLQLSGIFRRAWRFRSIAVEEPSLQVRFLADGKLSLADLFEPAAATPAPEEKKSYLPRLIVDHFVLRRGRAEFADESRSPRFVQAFEPLNLQVRDLTTLPGESGNHTVTIGLGENSLVRWSGKQTVEPLRLEGRVEIAGIPLDRVWAYAAPGHPLDIVAGRSDIALSYEVRREAGGSFAAVLKDATVKARGITVRPRGGGEDWLVIPDVAVVGVEAAWPEARVRIQSVRCTDPRLLVRREATGAVNWASAVPPATPKTEGSKAWTGTVEAVEIKNGGITLDDRGVDPAVVTALSGLSVRLEKVSTDLSAPVKTAVEAAINGSGRVSVAGTVTPDPMTASLDLSLADLDLRPFQPYAVRLPGAEFKSGVAAGSGRLLVAAGTPWARFDGGASLSAVQIAGGGDDRLVALDRAQLKGVRVTLSPDRVRVTEIEVDGAFLKLHIDRQGNVNLSKLGTPAGAPAAAGTPAPQGTMSPTRSSEATAPAVPEGTPPQPTPPASPAPGTPASRPAAPAARTAIPADIGKVVIKDATADYTDESLILPFGTKIHSVNGDIRDISTTASAPARLVLEGRVAEAGYFKTDGTIRLTDPLAAADINVIFRNVNMPDLTPYTAQFAGYSVTKGSLDVDVRYRLQDRHLVGDHRITAKDLVLGPKVEGANAPSLPVRLAIALLKDKDGRINLEVPVEGTVDSPEFSYRAIFWQAFKQIMGNIVKAPFRALGHLFGADKEDLELVGFASGRSDLLAPEQEKLAKMAGELSGRSEISLEIEGRFDPVTDADSLRNARLEAKIDAKRTPDSNLDAILESLYAERFTPEKLAAKRVEFQPGATAPPAAGEPSRKRGKKEPPPPPPREGFDAAAFYESLRKELLDAETIADTDLQALARARAEAIAAALSAPGGLDPSRVKVLDPAPVKRKKQGSDLVASEMMMNAKD
jgi:uncharacterized protein involved in outer membrane biogenesis